VKPWKLLFNSDTSIVSKMVPVGAAGVKITDQGIQYCLYLGCLLRLAYFQVMQCVRIEPSLDTRQNIENIFKIDITRLGLIKLDTSLM